MKSARAVLLALVALLGLATTALARDTISLIWRSSIIIFSSHKPNIKATTPTAAFTPLGPLNGMNIPPRKIEISPRIGQRRNAIATTRNRRATNRRVG